MNIFEESVFSKMDNLIQDFYRSADKVIKNFKSTGKTVVAPETQQSSTATVSRPTLKPIVKMKQGWNVFSKEEHTLKIVYDKLNECIDRINLLTENYKLSKDKPND